MIPPRSDIGRFCRQPRSDIGTIPRPPRGIFLRRVRHPLHYLFKWNSPKVVTEAWLKYSPNNS